MDKKYLMGHSDGLTRSASDGDESTFISPGLRANLMMAAMKKACEFYSMFLDKPVSEIDYKKLANEYERIHSNAISIGLFVEGGIREKDHLNFWCLGRILLPEVYVESGVFIGSSLHAFINSPNIKKTVALDPNLGALRIPKQEIPGRILIDREDFSQIIIEHSGRKSLVYFDDHINTADRILQAHKKGFRYVLFDDSTGFEGICQRLYPAIPTIPMIMNCELLNQGDELSWSFRRPSANRHMGLENIMNRIIRRSGKSTSTRVSLIVTQELIDKCFQSKEIIKRYAKIPDLGEFIPQVYPEKVVDTSKFLVELNQSQA